MVCALLLSFGACGKAKEEGETPSADESAFSINGLEFRLDGKKNFRGISYSVSEDFREIEHSEFTPYVQYDYMQEDSSNLLFFRIFYYKGQGNDAAVKDLGIEGKISFEDGKTGDIEYEKYVTPRSDGGTMNFYFFHKDGDTYVLSFVSRYDVSEFEKKVVGSVAFE